MVYILLYIIERFLTPIVFVFYVLFRLVEVGDASKFMLVVIGKIGFIVIDGHWGWLNMVLFWGWSKFICQVISNGIELFR